MLDAVHGYIHIPVWAKTVIDLGIFQRLGHIRQLTSAQYVFPGAQHTRKSHSIGAMHIASKYINTILSKNENYSNDQKKKIIMHVELAALLHDIAHGSFSHSFDSTIYSQIYPNVEKGHDVHRHKLLPHFSQHINFSEEMISDIWNGKLKHLSALINGPVSCDRGDFLKRDSYFCGINYGIFDMDRIIANSWFDKNQKGEDVLVYDSKIVPSIIQGLTSRLYLYSEIYLHKNVIAASILIELMILEASKFFNYIERTKNIEEFIYLNDGSIFHEILDSRDNRLSTAKKYAKALYERKLPKMISEERKIYKGERLNFGITLLDDSHVKWISRVLSKDFISEFEEDDIHISKNSSLYTFREYASLANLEISTESYYYERIYVL